MLKNKPGWHDTGKMVYYSDAMARVSTLFAILFLFQGMTLMHTPETLSADFRLNNGLHLYDAQAFEQFTLRGLKLTENQISLDSAAILNGKDEEGPAAGHEYVYGTATSPEILSSNPFRQIIVSWNAVSPPGSWLVIEARAFGESGWTRWFNMGWWNADNSIFQRTSPPSQRGSDGRVDTDVLILASDATKAQVRVKLCSIDAQNAPQLRRLGVALTSSETENTQDSESPSPIWGSVLNVPEISQLAYPPRGNVWCSPVSVAMVMNYWAEQKSNPEWKAEVRTAADAIYDEAWKGTGNWAFNTAYAGTRLGLAAYLARFESFREAEEWISRGVPVVLSISSNILHGRGESGGGHLIVLVGFDEDGNPVVNDPYANLEKGESVRRVYDRERLLKAWRNNQSLGTVYIIHPENMTPNGGEGE